MSSKEKELKTLQDKLKVFFKKGATGGSSGREEQQLPAELARELASDAPAARRARALRDLADVLNQHTPVSEASLQKAWVWCRRALDASEPEVRGAALRLAGCLAPRAPPLLRAAEFRWLRDAAAADAAARLAVLHHLTDHGKNVACFEEEIGTFLVEWIREADDVTVAGNGALQAELLQLLTNVVKYNAAYLDEPVVQTIVEAACGVCRWSGRGECVDAALALCEAVAAYSLVPRGALQPLVRALCACLAKPGAAPAAWRVLRALLGGAAGAQALGALAHTAADGARPHAARAAVYALGAALWSGRRAFSAAHLPLALPALLAAARLRLPAVTLEVLAAAHALLSRGAPLLHELYWEQLLRVLLAAAEGPADEAVERELHALLTSLERLHDAGQFRGDVNLLADLIERVAHARPESSSLRVVAWRAAALGGAAGAEWAARAGALADRWLRGDARRPVRLAALHALLAAAARRALPPDDALDALLPILSSAALDPDAALRAAAAAAAPALAAPAGSDAVADLVDLLEKILNRPFDIYVAEVAVPAEGGGELAAAAGALAALAAARLPRPPAHPAARALLVLVDHLHLHYKRPTLFMHHPQIRLKILELLFALRANEFNCVGLVLDEEGRVAGGAGALRRKPLCSPFLLVEGWAARGAAPAAPAPAAPAVALLPAGRLARLLLTLLHREADWAVLGWVLRALPELLQARALVLGRRAHDLDELAGALCAMLAAGAGGAPRAELAAALLAALVALAPLQAALEPATAQRLVRALLKHGMVARAPQPALLALTLLTLETRDAMARMLPEVLLDLSKVSDTQAHAAPMLEFLSTLTRLPRVFASFVEDQYMSVFAIVLPYTNPSRYNHYVVSLAHHVIAAWFLKCRLSYRRNFVRFIIHGLHNYIIVPFEEQLAQGPANEDSSTRQRSSSLGSRAPRGALGRGGGAAGAGAGAGGAAGASAAFHVELTETCVELLARYTHTPVGVKPARSDAAGWLLRGGAAATWLVGHRLVTITTTGCHNHPPGKQALCDRCAELCRQHAELVSSPLPPLSPPPANQNTEQELSRSSSASSGSQPPPAASPAPATPAPNDVKRGRGLWARGSSDTSSSSLSELAPPAAAAPAGAAPASLAALTPPAHRSPLPSRQNSSESRGDALLEALAQYSQRFERTSKEVDTEEAGWGRAGEGSCACWCGAWAQVTVRAPTGDVSWLQRLQTPMSSEDVLREVAALLPPAPPPAPADPPPRPRSSSGGAAAYTAPAASEYKSRAGTRPINIPAGPPRHASDDQLLLMMPEGKSRQPVKRSNSSPEMSSWKASPPSPPPGAAAAPAGGAPAGSAAPAPAPPAPPRDKKNKKPERVSCEAIPEEISGTSPANPHTLQSAVDKELAAAPPAPPAPSAQHHHLQKGGAAAVDRGGGRRGRGRARRGRGGRRRHARLRAAAAVPQHEHRAHLHLRAWRGVPLVAAAAALGAAARAQHQEPRPAAAARHLQDRRAVRGPGPERRRGGHPAQRVRQRQVLRVRVGSGRVRAAHRRGAARAVPERGARGQGRALRARVARRLPAGVVPRGDGDAAAARGPQLQREAQVHRQRHGVDRVQRLGRGVQHPHAEGAVQPVRGGGGAAARRQQPRHAAHQGRAHPRRVPAARGGGGAERVGRGGAGAGAAAGPARRAGRRRGAVAGHRRRALRLQLPGAAAAHQAAAAPRRGGPGRRRAAAALRARAQRAAPHTRLHRLHVDAARPPTDISLSTLILYYH